MSPIEIAFAIIMVGLGIIVTLYLLLLPWLIARERQHPSKDGILFLCVVGGISVIGWVAALIWAYSGGVAHGRGVRCPACNVMRTAPHGATLMRCANCGASIPVVSTPKKNA